MPESSNKWQLVPRTAMSAWLSMSSPLSARSVPVISLSLGSCARPIRAKTGDTWLQLRRAGLFRLVIRIGSGHSSPSSFLVTAEIWDVWGALSCLPFNRSLYTACRSATDIFAYSCLEKYLSWTVTPATWEDLRRRHLSWPPTLSVLPMRRL
jgi:hypothetical protein